MQQPTKRTKQIMATVSPNELQVAPVPALFFWEFLGKTRKDLQLVATFTCFFIYQPLYPIVIGRRLHKPHFKTEQMPSLFPRSMDQLNILLQANKDPI